MAVGDLIRELRSARGWSQGRLASELVKASDGSTITRETVSRWERGAIRCPNAFWLRHLAGVLQVPLEVLEDENVDRRRFTSIAAVATGIAPIIASDLIHGGFSAALAGGPDVDEWREVLTNYGRDYMSLGAGEIQKRLTADMLVIQQQLDRPERWEIAARLATLYAKTYPGSDGVKAVTWYRTATQAADRSGDPATRVWVRGRAAIALGYEGAALGVAETLAREAEQIDDRPSLGRLNAVMGRAHVAAIRGDDQTALTLLDQGRRIFDVAGSDEQESDYAVPYWRMNVFESLLLARLGDENGALRAQDTASATLPASLPRFATHLEMHKGLMLARAGDKAGGVAYAQTALDKLPPEKHSLTLRLLMSEVEDATGPTDV
ncbi:MULTISPECIES: helix-turn-helix domain-containing protein [unclassified Frankia]|uniref:helix-turn-helix domain-containing protein n=1 Tax=unclassified Frankia TaxID=2632575 RepID=UPI001EF5B8AA|nr:MULTISPECIES: helix-turn-helix transcriptional regulator [unclassified Frankia]